jgi:rhodanese-related sulfurtransferase
MPFLSSLFGSRSSQSNACQILKPETFKSRIENKEVQLVDVRTALEFKSGHIKGAQHIDFFSRKFKEQFEKLDKDRAVYVYCRSGSRSRHASKKIEAMGFKAIYDLEGGIQKYK